VGVGDSVVESVQLYDFSTGSYPYGNWVEVLRARAIAHAGETLRFNLPVPASRWVSYEGDLFVKMMVDTGNTDARLLVDKLWFLWQ
jgi:carotenoid cleavage dioxygenase-like enzyme